MKIRPIKESDVEYLRRWHAGSGFEYPFPDISSPEFVACYVVADDDDKPIQAYLAKETIEMYALFDPQWQTPRRRIDAMVEAHEAVRLRLKELGYKDVNCWIPPQIEKSFGRRLSRIFGWVRSQWASYSRKIEV